MHEVIIQKILVFISNARMGASASTNAKTTSLFSPWKRPRRKYKDQNFSFVLCLRRGRFRDKIVNVKLAFVLASLEKTGLILHHKDISTHLIDAFSSWICFLSRSASSCMVCLSRCSLVVYSTAETKTKTKWNQKQKQNKTDRQTNEKHKTTSIPQDNADHITTCLM